MKDKEQGKNKHEKKNKLDKNQDKPKEEVKKQEQPVGFDQYFLDKNGSNIVLSEFLTEKDWWNSKNNGRTVTILTHEAVQKIAMRAGLIVVDYVVKTQPDVYNNYQYTVQALIVDSKGNQLNPEWGEANRSNLGAKGKNNPGNMAQKRAFDRTVLRGLGLTGLLGEEELADNNEEEKMNVLKPDQAKLIAPVLNQVLLVKTKDDLAKFNAMMKADKDKYSPEQLDAIRKAFNAKVAELNKTKF